MVFKDSFRNKGFKSSFIYLFLIYFLSSLLIVDSQTTVCKGPDEDTSLLKWSDASTWGGTLPKTNDFVQIKNGMKVLLDTTPPAFTQVWIQSGGQLVFTSKKAVELITGGILIEGRLDIGDDRCRFNGSATITLTGIDNQGYSEPKYDMLRKYIGVLPGGRLEMHGIMSYPIPTWLFLTKTIKKGDTLINLNGDASNWPIGSKIAIGATDFDFTQSEENEIISCPNCTKSQLLLKNPVQWYHYGEITYGVDERAEVGLLSKTITIRGQMQSGCNGTLCQFFNFDTFGGHIKVVQNFSSVHIQGVELYNMGQTYNLGYYPIHFHMCSDVDTGIYASWPTFIKDTSIHHTFSRCLTIHGTSGLIVVNNFAFDHIGHCYFFEDGSEQRNYLDSNVGLLTKSGYLLPSDRSCDLCLFLNPYDYNGNPTSCLECKAVSTFWVTNPNNVLRNNIAGGSEAVGIWYLFPPHPSGLSEPLYPYISPSYTTVGTFYNNKVHSNADTGMNVDQSHQVVPQSAQYPNQFMSMTYARYKPRVNPQDENSAIAPAYFYRLVAYKNKWRGMWARGGEIYFIDSQFADNAIGATLAQEGVMPSDPGSSQHLIGCTFVGESDNLGMKYDGINLYNGRTIPAWQEFTQRGVEFYDGPVNVAWTSFINYNSDGVRNMSGIGWVLYNAWNFNPKNKLQGITFSNSNTKVLTVVTVEDGSKNEAIMDVDGSLTGTAGASIVHNNPYFYSPRCLPNQQWNMSVCYEKFASLYIYNQNVPATRYPSGVAGVTMIRDQYSSYRHTLTGVPNSNPTNTFMPLVMIGRTYTMHFPHPSPPQLRIQMTNFDRGDTIVVGVCYPTWGVTFQVTRNRVYTWQTFITNMTQGNSISDVNNDASGNTWYYDSRTGLLFLRFTQINSRPWAQYCPLEGCESLNIVATGSGLGTNSGDCSAAAYGTGTYSKIEYATRGGCNGAPELQMDNCGICGGNGSLCAAGGSNINSAMSMFTTSSTLFLILIQLLLYLININ